MNQSLTRWLAQIPAIAWIVIGLALLLRLAGVAYGLPQQLDPDEELFVSAAGRMLANGSLDPGFYHAPASTLIDALVLLYGGYVGVGLVTGFFDGFSDVVADLYFDVSAYFLIGRVFTAIIGTACLFVVYKICRELGASVVWSTAAIALLAVSPLMIHYSSIIRMDMLQVLFNLLIALFVVKALETPDMKFFVGAGIALGLAVTSKYPGLVGVVLIIAAAVLLRIQGRLTPRMEFRVLIAAGVASVVTAFVVGPYLFINFSDVLTAVTIQTRPSHVSATSTGLFSSIFGYLTEVLPQALTYFVAVLASLAIFGINLVRHGWVVSLFFVTYLVFIASLSLFWARWALPLIPFVVIALAVVVDRLDRWLSIRFTSSKALRYAAVALLVLPLGWRGFQEAWTRATDNDTRVVALQWAQKNVPEGATVLVETYAPALASTRYRVLIANHGRLIPWADLSKLRRPTGFYGSLGDIARPDDPTAVIDMIEARGVDYIFLSNWVDRYRAEKTVYGKELAMYELVLESFPTVRTFSGADADRGPMIRVLRVAATSGALDAKQRE
ncbi:MAG: glycosyltransferase family 39 protein [Alphaproteobacteria bacterium]|nr:glycosyltransferase family 39 protein [Alphaproteobacteria bacterium]